MSTEDFKQQQHDRIEEGKELKREDELTDLSNIPSKQLPGVEHKSIFSKISQGISNVATTISEKVGLSEPVVEGHEDLDKDVRKQVKKVNKEILKQAAEKGPEVQKVNEWEHSLPKHAKKEVEGVKSESEGLVSKVSEKLDEIKDSGDLSSKTTIQPNRDGPSPIDKINDQYDAVASKVEEVVGTEPSKPTESTSTSHSISEKISHGIDNIKQRFGGKKEEETVEQDGTKAYRTVKDGFNESVDDLKHEKRVEDFGGQEELSSKNPFQSLTSSSNKPESESRTLGEKVKGGLNDASQKISSSVGEVSQKVKSVFVHKENTSQDKENAQQIA